MFCLVFDQFLEEKTMEERNNNVNEISLGNKWQQSKEQANDLLEKPCAMLNGRTYVRIVGMLSLGLPWILDPKHNINVNNFYKLDGVVVVAAMCLLGAEVADFTALHMLALGFLCKKLICGEEIQQNQELSVSSPSGEMNWSEELDRYRTSLPRAI